MASSRNRIDGRRLLVLVGCVALGVVLWDYPVLWPLKILVVAMHESGHAIATWFVGGSVDRITLSGDESGACLSRLPEGVLRQIVVYSAGYVGSALAGGLLVLATFRWKLRRSVLGAATLWLVLVAVLYAGNLFTMAFCLGTAAVLGLIAWKLPDGVVEATNLFLAAFSVLYAVRDLRDDLWNSAVRSRSDAALLSDLTLIPAVVWAAIWTLLSLLIVGGLILSALRKGPSGPSSPLRFADGRRAF